jgi:hypothetical protein
MKIRVILPAPDPVQPPLIRTDHVEYLTYDETVRLPISTPGLNVARWRSGKYGRLMGVTVFAGAIDTGDFYSITLNGRALKSNIYPVAGFSQEEDFNEPIYAGDTVALNYNSQGTTAKNIDFTPRVKYDPAINSP